MTTESGGQMRSTPPAGSPTHYTDPRLIDKILQSFGSRRGRCGGTVMPEVRRLVREDRWPFAVHA